MSIDLSKFSDAEIAALVKDGEILRKQREYQREYQRKPEVAAKRREYKREYSLKIKAELAELRAWKAAQRKEGA